MTSMRTIVRAGLAVLVVLVPACGGSSEGYFSTGTLHTALRQAGFTDLRVISQKNLADQLSERMDCKETPDTAVCLDLSSNPPPDEDAIYSGPTHKGWPTLMAARLPSSARAKKVFERGYNPEAISQGITELRKYGALPAGFARDKLRAARVCNVILWSYNADRDPHITVSFGRAVRLLRGRC
jgi:hypothetical protein